MRGRQFTGGSGAVESRSSSVLFARANKFEGSPEQRDEQRDESTVPPWRCRHDYPIAVFATEGGSRRAQCLGCKRFGPEGVDSEQARKRLLAAARSL